MNIVVCAKIVPDSEDVSVGKDGAVDLSKAHWGISEYDNQALEAGRRLAEENGAEVSVLTVGPTVIDKSALKKDLLSRGPEQLFAVVDDALADVDTLQTVQVLSEAIRKIGADLVICGEGSADRYAQQTGVQLGQTLGFATVNAVDSVAVEGDVLKVERLLEKEIEILEVPLPAVISVTSGINNPAVPKMKAILAAGKKPQTAFALSELAADGLVDAAVAVAAVAAPAEPDRKKIIFAGTAEESVAQLVSQLKQEALI